MRCEGVIDLSKPETRGKRRGGKPGRRGNFSYTVFCYRCPECKREVVLRANSFRGNTPVPGHGAVYCGGY